MKKFIFFGDSITDCGRNREYDEFPGCGYATLITGEYNFTKPGEYTFLNRGISGDRSVDLLSRGTRDVIYEKPDYLSILIGVNDVWHEFACKNGVSEKKFERVMDLFLTELFEELPNIKVFILEPFTMKGDANRDRYEEFKVGVESRARIMKRLAAKYNMPFIELQKLFEEKQKTTPDNDKYWLADGVHPTSAGHYMIAEELKKCFEANK